MDHRLAAQLLVQLLLDPVDDVVDLKNVAVSRNLAVKRDHPSSGAIVMDHQIVDPDDLLMGQDQLLDLLHELRRRRLSQKRI